MFKNIFVFFLTFVLSGCNFFTQSPAPVLIKEHGTVRNTRLLNTGQNLPNIQKEQTTQSVNIKKIDNKDLEDTKKEDEKREDVFTLAEKKQADKSNKDEKPKKIKPPINMINPLDNCKIAPYDHEKNNGNVIIASHYDNEVKAVYDGTVIYVGHQLKNYKNLVLIQHEKNIISTYANMGKIIAKEGETMEQGDIVGLLSKNKNQQYEFLFSIRESKVTIDPHNYLAE